MNISAITILIHAISTGILIKNLHFITEITDKMHMRPLAAIFISLIISNFWTMQKELKAVKD